MDSRRMPWVVLGLIGGIAGFVGGFVQFFSGDSTSLVNGSSGWYYFVPILLGLATLALFVPRLGALAVALPLGAVGIAVGTQGTVNALDFGKTVSEILNRLGSGNGAGIGQAIGKAFHSAFSPSAGFYLIVLGGLLLTLAWVAIVQQLISEGAAVAAPAGYPATSVPPSPGVSTATTPTASPAPTATPDLTVSNAPDPGPEGTTAP